jgi:hypothetical protein
VNSCHLRPTVYLACGISEHYHSQNIFSQLIASNFNFRQIGFMKVEEIPRARFLRSTENFVPNKNRIMPLSDDDSSYSSNDDESSDSSDDEPSTGALGSFMEKDKKKSALAQFDGFDDDDEDDDDNSVAEKMKSILELRKSLGMDNDAEFMKELREKEEEKKRLAAMSIEERMEYEEGKAGDVMSKIRERHAEKMKEAEAKRKAEAEAAEAERARIEAEAAKEALIREQRERIERECQEEEERRKAEKRAKKKKKEQEANATAVTESKSKETVSFL